MKKFIIINAKDKVATLLKDASKGDIIAGVSLKEDIKSGHKVALFDIAKDEELIKYAEPIAAASKEIKAGEWVHTHNTYGLRGRGDESFVKKEQKSFKKEKALSSEEKSPLKNTTRLLKGFKRPDGKVGLRNKVLIIPSVHCANKVCEKIARVLNEAVYITHQHGCSQLDFDANQTRRTLAGQAANPNVFAALIIGLGCEVVSSKSVALEAKKLAPYKDIKHIDIQELGGVAKSVAFGIKLVRSMLEEANTIKREKISLADIVLGTECGGSDSYSGLSANPALGRLSDEIIRAGGKVVLAETTELIGCEDILAKRADDEQTAKAVYEKIIGYEELVKSFHSDIRGANPSPGNIEGGLSSIEEKSLGCIYKAGTSPLKSVIEYAMPITAKGLTLMNTPGNDIEQLSAMVAGGINICVFTTGRGTPTGSCVVPTIKMSSNSKCAKKLEDLIDINAGLILDAKMSEEDFDKKLLEQFIEIASGKPCKAEENEQNDFSIWRLATTC